jgi:hypothetical protein
MYKKQFFENTLPCAVVKRTANIYLCRAFSFDARQTYIFAVRFPLTHGKGLFHLSSFQPHN